MSLCIPLLDIGTGTGPPLDLPLGETHRLGGADKPDACGPAEEGGDPSQTSVTTYGEEQLNGLPTTAVQIRYPCLVEAPRLEVDLRRFTTSATPLPVVVIGSEVRGMSPVGET